MSDIIIQLVIPDSIDRDLLCSFIEGRNDSYKKPMTQRAIDMMIRKLTRLEIQGHCPNLLLERSIINGWKDVFPDETTKKREGFAESHASRDWADGLRIVK